ncbi:hypothetical protein [Bradyrhizobium sp. F1.13.3]|uniref:hypothetical protein n=1 Tax=Bradyrhizobium sp. F1.13.3 TaxID=3156351 RepID=UPI003392BA38
MPQMTDERRANQATLAACSDAKLRSIFVDRPDRRAETSPAEMLRDYLYCDLVGIAASEIA